MNPEATPPTAGSQAESCADAPAEPSAERSADPTSAASVFAALGANAARVVEVESLRLRARADRMLTRWLGLALLAMLVLAAVAMAGVQLARGLAGSLNALFGGPEWLGPLLAGLLLPTLAIAGLQLIRARRARQRLHRAQELSEQAAPSPRARTPSGVTPVGTR